MSDRCFVATRKGLFEINRDSVNGGRWSIGRSAFLGDPVSAVLHDGRSGAVYAALHHGHFGSKLHRSTDGGVNWQECTAPAYPEPPADAEEIRCPVRNIPIPWSLQMMWSLETGGPDQPGRLWCGTLPGGLFRSDDEGDSWQLMRTLWDQPERKKWSGGGYDYPGIHSITVDPRDPRRLHVAVSCGGVWVTDDDGATWRNQSQGMRASYMPPDQQFDPDIQDPHRMVQCIDRPDVLWVQHHNGVFLTTDGAASWQEIETARPSGFGFAVAVHPHDADTAWFAPAVRDEVRIPVDGRFVVSRTRDGGRTFDILNEGLPKEPAYDLVYRHGLDVSADGQRLMLGSTTGSLHVSEDGGDHWQCVSRHLPPVYAVRFAQ